VQRESSGNGRRSAIHGIVAVDKSDDNNVTATQEGKRRQQQQWHHFTVTAAVDNSCHCSYWGVGILLTASQCSGIIAAIYWRRKPLAALGAKNSK